MIIELIYLTTCNSQYFGGCHLPVLQVEVDRSTRYGQVKRELKEYYTGEHLDDSIDYDELTSAIDRCFEGNDLRKSWDKTLAKRPDDEYEYDCYAYFSVKVIPRFSTTEEAEDVLNASDKLVKISEDEWVYKVYEMTEEEVEPPRFTVTEDTDGKVYAVHKQYFFKKGERDLSSGFLDDLDDEKKIIIGE
jgi:hypothetical protein